MASAVADSRTLNKCGNSLKRIRVIGKIRHFMESESLAQNSNPWISVKKPQEDGSLEKCMVSLDAQSTNRKNEYELDDCYNPNEDISHIYSREIKPLISKLFDGQNASIVALGAKRSGKTSTIQGSQEKPGLAVMAISEILQKGNELGKSVSISLFTVVHDQAYDLLNPNHPAVQVLEDAHGRINLKGLHQVTVTSVSEFCDIYFRQGCSNNTQKLPHVNQSRNHHKGLMVQISSKDNTLKTINANKIHFVDLAGYEDPRKNKKDGVTLAESNRVNKSLHALVNVISAINANDVRVPYRESKLTRILQDSLGATSHVLLLTCLNPAFCHDSISSLSLVARLCQNTKQTLMDSTNRIHNSSVKVGKIKSASLSGKKHLASAKRSNFVLKGREPLNEEKVVNPMQALHDESNLGSTLKSTKDINLEESLSLSISELPNTVSCSVSTDEVILTSEVEQNVDLDEIESRSISELPNTLPSNVSKYEFTLAIKEDSSPVGDFAALANVTNATQDNRSPLLSERIREISTNLKKLCTSTPLLPVNKVVKKVESYDILEPKTPIVESNNAMCGTPQSTFSNRSSVMKQVLVQDYLNFLNSANKEELKGLKGIGEKRATYILELREDSPEPFKSLDDLQDIGLSAKQIKGMMRQVAGELFH